MSQCTIPIDFGPPHPCAPGTLKGARSMPHPLEQSYNWRTPAIFAIFAAVTCIGVLAHGQGNGWVPALTVVIALWALIVGLIYLRTRAFLIIDGSS